MTRKRFTDQEKVELQKNPNILKVRDCNATFSPKFKIFAVKENQKGKTAKIIFSEAGINPDILGTDGAKSAIKRWRKKYKEEGEEGLINPKRAKGCGRTRTKPLTLEEAEAKIALLEAENEFLKKLDLIERGLM